MKNLKSEDMSITAWIKTTDVGYDTSHYNTMYIAAAECGGVTNDWGFGVDKDGCLAFGNGGTLDLTFRTSNRVNTGIWTHVAVTRVMKTGVIRLYINGIYNAGGVGNTTKSSDCPHMAIGDGQDGDACSMGGRIGRVAAYDAVLSDMEIAAQFNNESRYKVK